MAGFLDEVEENYDLIIINCAPTESIFTTAAYLSADSVLIPVRPEFLSTIGSPQSQQSLSDFSRLSKKTAGVAGIVFSHSFNYVPEAYISKKEAAGGGCAGFKWHVFSQEIPYSRFFPKGTREGKPIFHISYAQSQVASKVAAFCDAFAAKIDL